MLPGQPQELSYTKQNDQRACGPRREKIFVTFMLQHAASEVTKTCVLWLAIPKDTVPYHIFFLEYHSCFVALLHSLEYGLFKFCTCSLKIENIFLKSSGSKQSADHACQALKEEEAVVRLTKWGRPQSSLLQIFSPLWSFLFWV